MKKFFLFFLLVLSVSVFWATDETCLAFTSKQLGGIERNIVTPTGYGMKILTIWSFYNAWLKGSAIENGSDLLKPIEFSEIQSIPGNFSVKLECRSNSAEVACFDMYIYMSKTDYVRISYANKRSLTNVVIGKQKFGYRAADNEVQKHKAEKIFKKHGLLKTWWHIGAVMWPPEENMGTIIIECPGKTKIVFITDKYHVL